jgi:hypothetical protein
VSVVRPEYGPTLPELLGPRLRALPVPVRVALAVTAAVVVAVLLWALVGRGAGGERGVVVREPLALNFIYQPPFTKLAPRPGELAAVGNGPQRFSVSRLMLPPYRGDASGTLPIYASGLAAAMARRYPDFAVRQEGRANINRIQGYELVFQTRIRGRLTYGRRILLLPTTTAREGVDLLLLAPRSAAIPRADAIGRNGGLKTALRSLRFGTERP